MADPDDDQLGVDDTVEDQAGIGSHHDATQRRMARALAAVGMLREEIDGLQDA